MNWLLLGTVVAGLVATSAMAQDRVAAPAPVLANFAQEQASAPAAELANWVVFTADNGKLPFMIIDKV